MKTTTKLLIIAGALTLGHNPAFASAPTPTPHADHKLAAPNTAKVPAAAATLNAELEKPISRPEGSNLVNTLPEQDLGGLNDVGDVGGDFEE